MSDSVDVIDHHLFEVWDYSDGSIDISCSRGEFTLDDELAFNRACAAARAIKEAIWETTEVLCVRLYENGYTSCQQYVDDEGPTKSWRRFKWLMRGYNHSIYGSVLALPGPPTALTTALWWVEWAFGRVTDRVNRMLGRPDLVGYSYLEVENPEEVLGREPDFVPEPGSNVVLFPRR